METAQEAPSNVAPRFTNFVQLRADRRSQGGIGEVRRIQRFRQAKQPPVL